MKISGIYKIQSKCKPERIYIGSAINIKDRWRLHLWELELNRHHSSRLQNHYNKYGGDDLDFTIIEPCLPAFCVAREQEYLDNLNPFFNMAKIAGSTLGMIYESRRGKPTWRKGKPLSEEHKRKISESMSGEKNHQYGKPSPNKGKKMPPNKWKGKKGRYSEETLEKMRKSNKRAWEIRKQKNAA
jgi:group I intron endonuclease